MSFTLADYTDIREIARGGMGKVYVARQTSLNRTVVIKEMSGGLVADEAQIRRFENEAKSAAALSHPNVIRVYDFGRDGDSFYISMEHIDGPSLEQLLAREDVPKEICLMVLLQALKGLHFAHAENIAHRDVKPGNIMVRTSTGEAKILDFGLAHACLSGVHLTATDAIVGTPQYMSPEQANGTEHKDVRMDIFSVGVLTYQILTGALPFTGNTIPAVLYSITQTKERDIEEAVPWLPGDVAHYVRWALVKDPRERLASLEQLIRSLQNMFYEIGIRDVTEQVRLFLANPQRCTFDLVTQLLDYHVTRGRTHLHKSETLKAKAHFDAALRYDPSNREATRVLRSLGDTGIRMLHAARERAKKAPSPWRLSFMRQFGLHLRIAGGVVLLLLMGGVMWFGLQGPGEETREGTAVAQPVAELPMDTGTTSVGWDSGAPGIAVETPESTVDGAEVEPLSSRRDQAPRALRRSTLDVRVDPPDAEVTVDGTRMEIRQGSGDLRLEPGSHTIEVTAEGYETYVRNLRIQRGADQALDVALKEAGPEVGQLHIHSYPWARVFVDGKYVGNSPTPLPLELSPGRHMLVLKRDGFESHEARINITADSLHRRQVRLRARTNSDVR